MASGINSVKSWRYAMEPLRTIALAAIPAAYNVSPKCRKH